MTGAGPPANVFDGAHQRLSEATLVTGNADKVAEARRICGLPLRHVGIDLPEIQSSVLEDVARAKVTEAWSRIQEPVIIDETALELSALNGFPGPLVKFMLDAIGPAGIARTAEALADQDACAVCLLVYYDGQGMVLAEGRTEGRIALPERGGSGFGFDTVFEPDGLGRTFAELGESRKEVIGHRGRAWRSLAAKLPQEGP